MTILQKIPHWTKSFNKINLLKFVSLAMLMFLILLNQNILKNISTSLIVNELGTESISFIKLWIQLPLGFCFMLLNIKLMNIMTSEQIFRIITYIFLLFFIIFAFVLFPNLEKIHPDVHRIEYFVQKFPHLKWFVLLWGNWCYILQYTMADFWPVVVLLSFYWQFANKINTVKEATTFYVPMGIISQSNMIFSSGILSYFLSGNHFLIVFFSHIENHTEILLKSLTIVVSFVGILILVLHRYIEMSNIDSLSELRKNNRRVDVLKYGIIQSLKLIFTSQYLILAFVVTISYSVCVHLIEGVWFSRAKALYTTTESFSQYQANVLLMTSIVALFFTVTGSIILKYFKWFKTISITPLMFLVFGAPFFISTILDNRFSGLSYIFDLSSNTLLYITITFASLQNILGKGAKYSLYDPTKEMVYIPLEDELKNKGKVAVTVLGAQLGKSVGSFVQSISFTLYPKAQHEDIAEFLFILFVICCIIWITCLKRLSVLYHDKVRC